MGDYRKDLGNKGEELACSYLQNMGHAILRRNYRSGHFEIDIISYAADGIHFVEVKSRKKNIQAPPQENVVKLKQKKIVKAALGYLNKDNDLPYADYECHFDIIAITFNGKETHLEWIPDAYIPIYT